MLKDLEISILREDEKILDLEEEKDVDEYRNKFIAEFESSAIGKVLLQLGYELVDTDFDDMTLRITYRKEKYNGKGI